MPEENKQAEQLAEYRKWLVAAEQKSQEDFDKTVLSLSSGALGISFIFLEDVIGPQAIVWWQFLLYAWLSWAFSTFSVLISYHLSHLALRRAVSQIDEGTIYEQSPGGVFASWTAWLNKAGAVLFLVGVCWITAFAAANLAAKGTAAEQKKILVNSSTASCVPAPDSTTNADYRNGLYPASSAVQTNPSEGK